MANNEYPACRDSRRCFAKARRKGVNICRILLSSFEEDGQCPFCKAFESEKAVRPGNPFERMGVKKPRKKVKKD